MTVYVVNGRVTRPVGSYFADQGVGVVAQGSGFAARGLRSRVCDL